MPMLWDIFNSAPFRAVELTEVLQNVVPIPRYLGGLGERLFPTVNARARMIMIARMNSVLNLIPVSPTGAPPVELELYGGDARPFVTKRLAKGSTVYAEELQGILNAPLFEAVRGMIEEITRRAGLIRDDHEATEEHMRLGAVMGVVTDADGVTIVDDWFANWGITQPAYVDIALNDVTLNPRLAIDAMTRGIWLDSEGAWVEGQTEIHALVGDTFFTKLVTHPNVEKTYLNYAAAAELRDQIADTFTYGGVVWHRWRGMPGGPFVIPDNEFRAFPLGAGAFQRVLGPGEFGAYVNQPGREYISMVIPDRDRDAWVRHEGYKYPLYVCLRPRMLRRGRITGT